MVLSWLTRPEFLSLACSRPGVSLGFWNVKSSSDIALEGSQIQVSPGPQSQNCFKTRGMLVNPGEDPFLQARPPGKAILQGGG